MTTISAPTDARSPEQIQYVIDSVHRYFTVTQEYVTEDGQTVQFFMNPSQIDTKARFLSLSQDLKKNGDIAFLRNTDHGLLLAVVRKPTRGKNQIKLPVALFIATVATVFIYGFLWGPFNKFQQNLFQDLEIGGIFAACLIAIIGIHEMGHKFASWHHNMDSSWPYFIPFLPIPGYTLPTMGAVISARDPPPNKDALFDLGISGPLAGLLTTIIVSVIAAASAQVIPLSSVGGAGTMATDIYTSWITNLMHSNQQGALTGSLFGALYFAYSLGFLLTFVNLLPAWQLDGGHIANAAVSPKVHKILTWVSAGIMVLTGFWLMAILILFFAGRAPSLRPLDDVSPLSARRRVLFWATWIIAAAIFVFTIYSNVFFWIGYAF